MNYLSKLAPYAKAVAAFIALLVPVLVSLGVLLTHVSNQTVDGGDLTNLGAAITALVAGTKAVYQVTNRGAE